MRRIACQSCQYPSFSAEKIACADFSTTDKMRQAVALLLRTPQSWAAPAGVLLNEAA
jgi:hypothetical protein